MRKSEKRGQASFRLEILANFIWESENGPRSERENMPVPFSKTTCQQDKEFLKMLESMEGTEDTYSVGRHNCRAFSQDMFNQAQKKYGK